MEVRVGRTELGGPEAREAAGAQPDLGATEAIGRLPAGHVGLTWSGERTVLDCVHRDGRVRLTHLTPGRRGRHDDLAALAAAAAALEQAALLDPDLPAVASRIETSLVDAAADSAMSGLLIEFDGDGGLDVLCADFPVPLRVSALGEVLSTEASKLPYGEPFGRTADRPVVNTTLDFGEGLLVLSWQARTMLTEREIREVLAACARPEQGRPAVGLAVGALWAMAAARADRRTRAGLAITAIARESCSKVDRSRCAAAASHPYVVSSGQYVTGPGGAARSRRHLCPLATRR